MARTMLGVLGKSAKEVLIRRAFVVWITSVAIMAIIPLSDSGLMASSDISSSGAEKHFVGYFVGALLLYYGYGKKENRGQRQRSEVVFIWLSGLFIFLYSVALEAIQFYLPYRTFNLYDVVANGLGVLLFVILWSYRLRFTDDEDKRIEKKD